MYLCYCLLCICRGQSCTHSVCIHTNTQSFRKITILFLYYFYRDLPYTVSLYYSHNSCGVTIIFLQGCIVLSYLYCILVVSISSGYQPGYQDPCKGLQILRGHEIISYLKWCFSDFLLMCSLKKKKNSNKTSNVICKSCTCTSNIRWSIRSVIVCLWTNFGIFDALIS